MRSAVLLVLGVFLSACGGNEAAKPAPLPAAAAPHAAPAASGLCGKDGHPDCPLQVWMKANLQAAARAQDFDRLQTGFERLGALAPESMPSWAKTAAAGSAAAKAHDISAVRDTCADCHEELRKRYRAEMRDRPLAGSATGAGGSS